MVDTAKNYTFLPWLRQGLAAGINELDNLGQPTTSPPRASIAVNFLVATQPGGASQPVSKTPQLLGPGDVVGINPRAIVKTEPRNWITDFEANYPRMNAVYASYFPADRRPARTCIGVTGLARGAMVEIDLLAKR